MTAAHQLNTDLRLAYLELWFISELLGILDHVGSAQVRIVTALLDQAPGDKINRLYVGSRPVRRTDLVFAMGEPALRVLGVHHPR